MAERRQGLPAIVTLKSNAERGLRPSHSRKKKRVRRPRKLNYFDTLHNLLRHEAIKATIIEPDFTRDTSNDYPQIIPYDSVAVVPIPAQDFISDSLEQSHDSLIELASVVTVSAKTIDGEEEAEEIKNKNVPKPPM